jgi:hypothetical protein
MNKNKNESSAAKSSKNSAHSHPFQKNPESALGPTNGCPG